MLTDTKTNPLSAKRRQTEALLNIKYSKSTDYLIPERPVITR